jgi:hypothetical protein
VNITNYVSETGWSSTTGGYIRYILRPSYQNGVSTNAYRGIPDLASNADPTTGFSVCFSRIGCANVGGNYRIVSPNLS